MTFAELIKSNSWLSVKMIFLNLYPDQEELMDDYQDVFDQLQIIAPVPSNITIDVELVHDTYDDTNYVDVLGYYTNPEDRINEYTNSLAIEFVSWHEWLSMPIDKNSLKNFSELEIIVYCLNEMTYAGFDQDDVQLELDRLKSIKEEYDKLTLEEKEKRTISLEELKAKYDLKSDKSNEGEEKPE